MGNIIVFIEKSMISPAFIDGFVEMDRSYTVYAAHWFEGQAVI